MQAINAAYEPLLFNKANNNFYRVFGEVASEEAIAGGPDKLSGEASDGVF